MIQQAKVLLYVLAALCIGLMIIRACVPPELRVSLIKMILIATVGSQIVAFLSPQLIIYHVAVAALIPLLARQRHQVAPLFAYMLLTLPLVSTKLVVGGVYLLTYDIGISLAIGALLGFGIAGSPQAKGSVFLDLTVALLIVLFTFAYARGTSFTNVARVGLDQVCLFGLPYLIVRRSLRTADDVKNLLMAIVVAGVALSALAAFEAVRAWPVYRAVWDHYGIDLGSGASVKMRGGFLRSPGPYPEPTSFAVILAVALVSATAIKSAFVSRTAHFIVLAVLVVGILAPQSRGAWLGAGVGILSIALFLRNWKLVARSLVAVAGFGIVAVTAASLSPRVARLMGTYNDMNVGEDYRTTLFARGVTEFWRSPLAGAPLDQTIRALSDIRQGEGLVDFVNSYLFVALISGAIGLSIFAFSLIWPMLKLLIERRRWAGANDVLRSKAAVFGILAALAVMLGFTSLGGRTTILLVVAIALAGSRPPVRAR